MSKKTTKNNVTVGLSDEENEDLEYLVDYFQGQSISTVTKSDVLKFLIKQYTVAAKKRIVGEVNQLIKEGQDGD